MKIMTYLFNGMEFISTKGMTLDNAPDGKVLVQYLEPFFGRWCVGFAIGYFDNPNDYDNEKGDGWLEWFSSKPINVLAYCFLPEEIEAKITELTQEQFIEIYGSFHPNLGSRGE